MGDSIAARQCTASSYKSLTSSPFDTTLVKNAAHNSRAIRRCYASLPKARESLLRQEKKKAIKLLKGNSFYKLGEVKSQLASMNKLLKAYWLMSGKDVRYTNSCIKKRYRAYHGHIGRKIHKRVHSNFRLITSCLRNPQQRALAVRLEHLRLRSDAGYDPSGTDYQSVLIRRSIKATSDRAMRSLQRVYRSYDDGFVTTHIRSAYRNSRAIRFSFRRRPAQMKALLREELKFAERFMKRNFFFTSKKPHIRKRLRVAMRSFFTKRRPRSAGHVIARLRRSRRSSGSGKSSWSGIFFISKFMASWWCFQSVGISVALSGKVRTAGKLCTAWW